MLTCPIEGCGKKFKHDKALNAHVRRCTAFSTALTSIAEDVQRLEEDSQPAKRRRTSFSKSVPVFLEPEGSADVNIEVF